MVKKIIFTVLAALIFVSVSPYNGMRCAFADGSTGAHRQRRNTEVVRGRKPGIASNGIKFSGGYYYFRNVKISRDQVKHIHQLFLKLKKLHLGKNFETVYRTAALDYLKSQREIARLRILVLRTLVPRSRTTDHALRANMFDDVSINLELYTILLYEIQNLRSEIQRLKANNVTFQESQTGNDTPQRMREEIQRLSADNNDLHRRMDELSNCYPIFGNDPIVGNELKCESISLVPSSNNGVRLSCPIKMQI
jgi:hypothetical protein